MPYPVATSSSDAEKPLSAQRSAIDLLSSDEDEEGEEEAEVLPSETGLASWYGPGFHKRRTASGERFDMHAMTAAHRTLPFGTMVCVRSQITGRGVVVRINDRGPHAANRVVDLSRGAAIALVTLTPSVSPSGNLTEKSVIALLLGQYLISHSV